jgi:hypothetical protein
MTKYAVIPEGTNMRGIVNFTIGKKYKILRLDDDHDHVNGLGFEIITDGGSEAFCIEKGCSHLNWQKWEIQESRRHDDKGLLTLKAVSVLTFVFIVSMCAFGL